MKPRVVRPDAHAIQSRFFDALDELIETGRVENLTSFCVRYGLHRPKYSNIRTGIRNPKNPGAGYKFIDIDALTYLVRDYGISADWLLQGSGRMYKE